MLPWRYPINKMAVIDSGRTSSVMSETFELPATTWTVIQSCCPQKEANELKRVIGHSLVEESCDLHTEATMLLEIWRQMREDSDPGRPSDNDIPIINNKLTDPPGMRDKLVQEIKFLVSYLQRRDSTSPVLAETIKSPTVNYVLNHDECFTSRPTSTCSNYHRCDTPSSSSSSVVNLLEIQPTSLSIHGVDQSITNLRETVRQEIQQRHNDIQLLQGYIDSELSYQQSLPTEPTIKELQSVSLKLEKQLLQEKEKNTLTTHFIHHHSPSPPPPPPPPTSRPLSNRTPINRASKAVRRSDHPLSPSNRVSCLPNTKSSYQASDRKDIDKKLMK